MSQLNAGQQKAAEAFFQMLFSPDSEMIISGAGGVGKSFLISDLIDRVMPEYFDTCAMMGMSPIYDGVVITATTNKAAEVLAEGTNRPCQTIHSFMNLKVKDDYSTGRSNIAPTTAWHIHYNKIIFIDECSMIDSQLYKWIKDGTHNCKIIYVGDHSQLAPVMEPISPIYKRNLPFFELTEPMRNNNQPALMNVCQQIRETVESLEFKPIQIVPGVIDYADDVQMANALQQAFLTQTHNSRILAYTNARVIAYNDHIRNLRKLPDQFTVGEYLVNTNALQLRERLLSVEEEITIVDISDTIETIILDDGEETKFQVQRATITSRIGDTFLNVPIPVYKQHFAALVKYYSQTKNWRMYFKMKNTYPDFRQRDAATIHKAQGSSYDIVFIDLGNISTCRNPVEAARLLYVAFTRARTRVILYGTLAEKYGGLIHV